MSLYNVYVGSNPKSNIKFIDIGYISAYRVRAESLGV